MYPTAFFKMSPPLSVTLFIVTDAPVYDVPKGNTSSNLSEKTH